MLNKERLLNALTNNGVVFHLNEEFGEIESPIGIRDEEAKKIVDAVLADSGWKYQEGVDTPADREFFLERKSTNDEDADSQAVLNFYDGEIFIVEEGNW